MSDLFSHHRDQTLRRIAPLAERLRPTGLEDFVGQQAILGPGRLLRRAIAADRVGNLILHGPPGTGKTTLARIIAHSTRAHFSSLNAVLAGVKDLRTEVEAARTRLAQHGLRTILFIDEVHRFNAAQQDALLPWVENGTLTLIGATTENPFFEVNKALVSRSRLFRLQPLERPDLEQLLQRALQDPEQGYGQRQIALDADAAEHLLNVAGGDARSLLNALELAVETTPPGPDGAITIDLSIAEDSIQQRAVLYDKQGDAHFDTISAYIKSIRGSDPDAALFWLARMIEAGENPRFILRRLLISAGEDIGLADPQAIVVVEACASAFERIGLPEGLYPLAQATLYLAATEKSNSSLGFFDAVKAVRQTNRQDVPSHLRDANRDGKAFGDGVGYRYPHAYSQHWVAQQYLPSTLQGEVFWQPGTLGWEGGLRSRLLQRRAAQLAAAAESACDPPELLSSGPDDPVLARWLQRQAAGEGERLDRLRQRFWQGATIGRLDRVLVLEARSLLWALDPLEAAAEGEVVLAVAEAGERERLQAQLQLLEPLRRPRLVQLAPHRLKDLGPQLESGYRFEWLVGRQPFRGLTPGEREQAIAALTSCCSPMAQARLLYSDPLLGPLGSLLAARPRPAGQNLQASLNSVLDLEQRQQQERQGCCEAVAAELQRRGWQLERESWDEGLSLTLSDGLLQRWFGPGADYRSQLEALLQPTELDSIEQLFRRQRGVSLPQPLRHQLLSARCAGGPEPEGSLARRSRSKRRTSGRSSDNTPARKSQTEEHEKSPGVAGAENDGSDPKA